MTIWKPGSCLSQIIGCCVSLIAICAIDGKAQTDTIYIRSALTLALPKMYAETIVSPNPVEAMLALDEWKTPREGEYVTFADGSTNEWRSIHVDGRGWFTDSSLRGCYLYCEVSSEKTRSMLLEAMGNEMVYVNGSPRSGNPYGMQDTVDPWAPSFNYSLIPVMLNKGMNTFLFRCSREVMKAKLVAPRNAVSFNTRDLTAPDFFVGNVSGLSCALPIVNATDTPLRGLRLRCWADGNGPRESVLPTIQPFSVRKCGFLSPPTSIRKTGPLLIHLALLRGDEILDTASVQVNAVDVTGNHKETFISAIDSSVQYYSVLPPIGGWNGKKALFLSLHGASVEAINQSGSYAPKSWGAVVSPTNRRPYGYNWEEWGRLDALEVLDITNKFPIDESRVYLTGHSMGGHGTWHLGTLYPDRFAAIGPSAGWISFWTYRFRGKKIVDSSAIRKMIRRSTTPSETFQYARNLEQLGVYIIHGDQDDNVFPEQSRTMTDTLAKFHRDFVYHEEPGAGHWWDNSEGGGSDCVDYPPLFDFFARHARPGKERIRDITFRTSNPSVSARDYWLAIDAQQQQLAMSMISMHIEPGMNGFVGSTNNVMRCSLDLDVVDRSRPVIVRIDSQNIKASVLPGQEQLWLEQHDGTWIVSPPPSPDVKGQRRYGTFKETFRNCVQFVYGTQGSREENQWAFDKARYDAEKFWYQGNGSINVLTDEEFVALKDDGKNVILYGNRDTNAAWDLLLKDSPVQVTGKRVTVGGKTWSGRNLGCIFVRPRMGNAVASIGVVSGTGITGMKTSNRFPYNSPGIGLPDCTVFSTDVLIRGDEGILWTGFFGLDWSVDAGEFVGHDGDDR